MEEITKNYFPVANAGYLDDYIFYGGQDYGRNYFNPFI